MTNLNEIKKLGNSVLSEVAEYAQWVVWQKGAAKRNGKFDKIPISPHTGKKISGSHENGDILEQASSFDKALDAAQKFQASGIGFILSPEDPFVGGDIDECLEDVNATKILNEIIENFDSYTEISPSRKGLRILCKGKLPENAKKKNDNFEIYDQKRFLTITGLIYGEKRNIKSSQAAISWFCENFTGVNNNSPTVCKLNMKSCSTTNQDLNLVKEALRYIPAEDYEIWLKVGMALHSTGEDDVAYSIWDAWSRTSEKYNEQDQIKTWRSFKGRENEITLGTLFHVAQDHGWCHESRCKSNSVTSESSDALRKRAEYILHEREACGPFDLSILPDLIQRYAKQICERTEASPVTVLTAILGTLSAMVGRNVYIPEDEYFNRLYGNIWTLTISPSGSFKTTALNHGCRMAWQNEQEIRTRIDELKKQKQNSSTSDTQGDRQVAEVEDKRIKDEIAQLEAQSVILPNRMSGEALLELLSTGQGGLIPASEMGEWLDNLGKTHNQGLKPLFTDLYDCPQQYSYRTRSGGHMIIQRPFISICGVSTLSWVQKNISLNDIGSGFFARFLLFYPPQQKTVPPALPRKQGPFDCSIENEIKNRINSVRHETPMHISREASEFFEGIHQGIYSALEQCDERDQELLSPYVKRWSPYVLKLAILFQIVINPQGDIGKEAIQAGAAVVEYAIKSTVHLFQGELSESQFQQKCRAVLEYIAKKDGSITRAKLLQSHVLQGGVKDYDEVLETLEQSGKVGIIESDSHKKNNVIKLADQG